MHSSPAEMLQHEVEGQRLRAERQEGLREAYHQAPRRRCCRGRKACRLRDGGRGRDQACTSGLTHRASWCDQERVVTVPGRTLPARLQTLLQAVVWQPSELREEREK